jgi:serine/threonine protein kinase
MKVAETLTGHILAERYELAELLGAGGSGSTYRARSIDTENQSSVAIKILSLQHLQDWKQLELFEREAKVLAQLNHPQIPQYLDYFHVDTPTNRAFYIVQQLAPGKPLTAWVQSGWRATEAEVRDIARQLLEILQYLHQQSPPLIHRDIKPHNIIRNDDGQVFLVDFGAVQNVYQNTLLKGSTVAGTYGYMSPEQFRGAAVPASDLYGLGATVLYLLTHRSPADLPQERLKLKFRDHVNISEHFADWLEMMMEPNVADRFSSAEKAAIALAKKGQIKSLGRDPHKSSWKISVALLAGAFLVYQFRYILLMSAGIQPNDFCSKDMDIVAIEEYIRAGGNPNVYVDSPYDFNEGLTEHDGHLLMLNCAIRYNKFEVAEYLLDHHADPNLFDNYNNHRSRTTSLHEAMLTGDERMVKLLLDRGANPNATNERGDTPLHCLLDNKSSGECRTLKVSYNLFEMFIKYKADPRVANKEGNTVLHIAAAQQNQPYIYDRLIQLGWDPLQKNKKGETAQQLMMPSKSPTPQSRNSTD